MKKWDSLGDRMKTAYEDVTRNYLMRNSDVIIRLDWKAFSNFTKWLIKPFDIVLIETMQKVVLKMAKEISWFKLAYLQSDEISIWINDTDTIQTQGWFDYNINKINSVAASLMTGYFNKIWKWSDKTAFFDCRCFNIPRDEIANYFLWRQKDWYRNSVQMYARSIFSHKQLQYKKIVDIFDMFYEEGVSREANPDVCRNWTFIDKNGALLTGIFPRFECTSQLVKEALIIKNTDE